MHFLGTLLFTLGFTGAIAIATLGLSRNLYLALAIHGILALCFIFLTMKRNGGVKQSLKMNLNINYTIHFPLIIFIGLVFFLAGNYFSFFAPTGNEPNSMNKEEQIYFGIVFSCMGAGLIPIAAADWYIHSKIKNKK